MRLKRNKKRIVCPIKVFVLFIRYSVFLLFYVASWDQQNKINCSNNAKKYKIANVYGNEAVLVLLWINLQLYQHLELSYMVFLFELSCHLKVLKKNLFLFWTGMSITFAFYIVIINLQLWCILSYGKELRLIEPYFTFVKIFLTYQKWQRK